MGAQFIFNSMDSKKPIVACIRPGALGDMIMTLNCTLGLKRAYPDHELVYHTGVEFKDALGKLILQAGFDRVETNTVGVKGNKVFTMVGYPAHLAYSSSPNPTPMTKHIILYFAEEMGLTVTLDELKIPLPPKPTPIERYITIHPRAKWSPYKNWPLDRWQAVCDHFLSQGVAVYQLGGPKDPKLQGLSGYPMEKGLDESLSFLAHAGLHLGVDSWTNHATNIIWGDRGRTKAVILWGSSQASAAGYTHNKNIQLGLSCQPCFKEDPKLSLFNRGICTNPPDQTYKSPNHACMKNLTLEQVLEETKSVWSRL